MKTHTPTFTSIGLSLTLAACLAVLALGNQAKAQDEPVPENPEISSPTEGDNLAQEGMAIEEGLEPVPAPKVSEAAQSFADQKGEADLNVENQEANLEEAQTEATTIEAETAVISPVYGPVRPALEAEAGEVVVP
jgi:hypothetical protein